MQEASFAPKSVEKLPYEENMFHSGMNENNIFLYKLRALYFMKACSDHGDS